MSAVESLLSENSRWNSEDPASDQSLSDLAANTNLPLPDAYLQLLCKSNGGFGFLNISPYRFRLWKAEEVLSLHKEYEVDKYLPGFLAFGDSGAGEFFAFDTREGLPYKVFSFPFIGKTLSAADLVANSFDELIAQLVAKENWNP